MSTYILFHELLASTTPLDKKHIFVMLFFNLQIINTDESEVAQFLRYTFNSIVRIHLDACLWQNKRSHHVAATPWEEQEHNKWKEISLFYEDKDQIGR